MNRGRTMLTGLLLAVGLVALTVAPAVAAHHHVEIEQYAYGPSSLNVTQGDTVTWTNLDEAEHDVVVTNGPQQFRSPMLRQGQSWTHTFTVPGTYTYICSVHPDMRAAVAAAATVVPPTVPPPTPSAPATAPPATAAAAPSATAKPTQHKTPKTPKPSATATPEQAVATVPTPAVATTDTTLDPLLLVAGAAIAVVVFCLLLMASRPIQPVPAQMPVVDESNPDDND